MTHVNDLELNPWHRSFYAGDSASRKRFQLFLGAAFVGKFSDEDVVCDPALLRSQLAYLFLSKFIFK